MSAILAPDGAPARRAERRTPRLKSWHQVYEAANRSDFRGYFYIPSLNPAEQLNNLSLQAIRERTDWLYANVPPVRMLIDGLSRKEAGTGIWPKWTTGAEDFDKAATDAYHFANHDPRVFSANGQDDAYSVQNTIRRCIARIGDCFGQLLRPAPGATHPQMLLIPGWQCDNFGDEKPESGWRDGIRCNELGRPVEYCFITADSMGKRQRTIVPAADVLHFHDPFMPGQRRGEPCLASVAKKLFRREDIGHALANGTLARERLGFAFESKDDTSAGPKVNFGGDEGDETVVKEDEAQSYTVRRLFGQTVNDEVEIPDLPPGTTIRTIESNRPGTSVMEFQDAILREAAWARTYPPSYVFFEAGIGQGTVSRSIQVAAGEVIMASREFQMRPQFMIRYPVFWIWQLISAGHFARLGIKVPANWWQNKLIFPALPTLDVGREGNLHDNRVATGKESIESYHGQQGEDAADVEDENTAAIKRRMTKLGKLNTDTEKERAAAGMPPFRYEDVWSRSINIQPPQFSQAPEPADP